MVVDLDGVVWRAEEPIDGASEGIERLKDAGTRIAFFTNNSFVTTKDLIQKLARQAIDASETELLSSARAAALLVHAGERVLVVGGPGCLEAIAAVGAFAEFAGEQDDGARFDAVVVGFDPEFTYRRLTQAQAALRAGARLIGTNSDATYPTPLGEIPGGGSILAAVATASGLEPVIAGKPNDPAVELVRETLGDVDLVVGDRPSTDGEFARRLGAEFGLVHSGVSSEGRPLRVPEYEADDLLSVVEKWLAHR